MTFQFVLSYWDLLGLHVRAFPRPLDNFPDDYNCFTSSAVFNRNIGISNVWNSIDTVCYWVVYFVI